ncbi:Uncharacterised protein [Bordetella pertussis]|nr:Uncharacterised protein [Bordetella pertussis]
MVSSMRWTSGWCAIVTGAADPSMARPCTRSRA